MKLQISSAKPYENAWKSNKRYIIRIGGRGGGRSYDVSLFIIAKIFQTARRFRGAIMRAIHGDIRHSIWQEVQDRLSERGINEDVQKKMQPPMFVRDSTMEIDYGFNSIHAHSFRKSSSDRTAKLKSLAGYSHAFIEEAEEIGEEEFNQLDESLRVEGSQIHLTLNTTHKDHWMIKRWFNLIPLEDPEAKGFYKIELKPEFKDSVEFIFCNHEDNTHLPEGVHERYEATKKTNPARYWQVIRGLSPETVLGKIYSGWKEIPEVPHEARLIGHYLDFGFDPDPAAVGSIYYHNGGYIVDEKLYALGLLNSELATHLKLLPPAPIIADSAEPKSIAELQRYGVSGIIGVEKGADSVEFGIKHTQGVKISFTSKSVNVKKEYTNYAWKMSKDTGESLGIEDPSCANHHMSGIRYFMMTMVKADADPDAELRRAMKEEYEDEKETEAIGDRFAL